MALYRRQFIQTSLGAAAAAVAARGLAASSTDDIRVAQIGFNGQGRGHIDALGKHVVALCDVDQRVLHGMADTLKERGQKVDAFADYRKLLERKDIDAVSIATPNHTHALIAIAAIEAGKHVYVEKPVSHNIWEGRQLVAAARRHDRIVQTGTQSRSSQSLKDAVEFVRSGKLGAIRYAVGTCFKPRRDIGKSDVALKFPDFVDRDLWVGPAEDQPIYRPEKNSQGKYNPHYDWHWDFNTGCGDLGNQGIHQMDIARWFLGETTLAPVTFSIGGRLGYDDAGNTPNTQVIYHGYEKAPLIFEVRGLPRSKQFHQQGWEANMDNYRGARVGVLIQCERGHVVIPSYVDATAYDDQGRKLQEWHIDGNSHHANWLEAIAAGDRRRLNADIQEGHLSSALCHAGNVSYRLGQRKLSSDNRDRIRANDVLADSVERMLGHLRANGVDADADDALTVGEWLTIDPATETFVGNDAANELRTRKYRAPFVVPDLEQGGQVPAAG